jgi:hypothetical protein
MDDLAEARTLPNDAGTSTILFHASVDTTLVTVLGR